MRAHGPRANAATTATSSRRTRACRTRARQTRARRELENTDENETHLQPISGDERAVGERVPAPDRARGVLATEPGDVAVHLGNAEGSEDRGDRATEFQAV